jgi:hypothetical protein
MKRLALLLLVLWIGTFILSAESYSFHKRIVIFPFKNADKYPGVFQKMRHEMKKILTQKGYVVVPNYVLKYYFRKNGVNSSNLNIIKMVKIAKAVGADYFVRGEIEKAYAIKKFRVTALIGGGVILYGNILANLSIISSKDGIVIFSKRSRQTSKRQFLGGFQEKKYILFEAARDIVKKKLLRDF